MSEIVTSGKKSSSKESEIEELCVKKGIEGRVWKFVHNEDYRYQSKILIGKTCNFKWLEITEDGVVKVKGSQDRGYAWDGCTPKFNFLHITWGNFDGQLIKHFDKLTGKTSYHPYTYFASMVHDVLYQYKRCVPVNRKETDLLFYEMLKESKFIWAWIFYAGVRLFGWLYTGWGKNKDQFKIMIKN